MDGVWSARKKAGWLLLTTALSSVVALEVTGHMPFHNNMPPVPPAPLLSEQPVMRPLRPPVLENIGDMLERPLFVMSRRPTVVPDVDVSDQVRRGRASDTLKLVGTVVTEKTRLALFHHDERGTLRRQQGQDIDGWRIAYIDQVRVRMRRGNEEEWLALHKRPAPQTKTSQPFDLSDATSAGGAAATQHSID